MLKTQWASYVGRWLVFGSVAVMGGVLALAQVAAPPPGQTRPAAPIQPPEAGQPGQPRRSAEETQPRRAAEEARPAGAEGQATRKGLGLEFDAQVKDGLSVSKIEPDGLAAQAGLRPGDRLVTIDGRQFATPRQFQAYLSGQLGRRVAAIIERGGQQYNVYFDMDQPAGDVAWLGVFLQEAEDQQNGVRITQIYPAGPAARAGLRPGDVIQQVNKQPVAGPAELIGMIEEMKPGGKAELTVLRGNQPVTITAVLGNRDQFVFYRGSSDEFRDERRGNEDDEFGNIPPYAMQLEHDRRMAEQHQRIEEELRKLQDEVRKLREALQPRN